MGGLKVIFIRFVFAVLLFVSFGATPSHADTNVSTLKGLTDVHLFIVNPQSALSNDQVAKLTSEIELKLKAAGMAIQNDRDKTKAVLFVSVRKLPRLTQADLLVQLMVLEKVTSTRKGPIHTEGFTYIDDAFFTSPNPSKDAYDTVMDKLLVRFLNKYMADNPG